MTDTADTPLLDDETVRELTTAILSKRDQGVTHRSLISVLQAIQSEFGFLPRPSMIVAANFVGVSPAKVYGVATFYNQFRFKPPGKHQVKVCMGTACAIKLGGIIMDSWQRKLGIEEGDITPDLEYSLERVACVGCCSMAPVTVVNEAVYGDMTPTKVDGILLRHRIARDHESELQQHDAAATPNDLEDAP